MAFGVRWTPFITPPLQFQGADNPEPDFPGVGTLGYPSAQIGTVPTISALSWRTILGHPTATDARFRPGGVYTTPPGHPLLGISVAGSVFDPSLGYYVPSDGIIIYEEFNPPFNISDLRFTIDNQWISAIPTIQATGRFDVSHLESTNTYPGQAPADFGLVVREDPGNPDATFTVDVVDSGFLLQPPDIQFLIPGGIPLHQRQRSDGLGGGPAHANGNTRQGGLFQRGIL
jgi:hypothetical protein